MLDKLKFLLLSWTPSLEPALHSCPLYAPPVKARSTGAGWQGGPEERVADAQPGPLPSGKAKISRVSQPTAGLGGLDLDAEVSLTTGILVSQAVVFGD